MKRTLLPAFIAAILLITVPVPVLAGGHSSTGPYVGGTLGIAFLPSDDVKNPTIRAAGANVDFTSKVGPAFGVALGYDFGNTRLEGEIMYQRNELDEARGGGLGNQKLSGHTKSYTFLLNGYYDFSNESPFTTFFTAGLGAARISMKDRLENIPGLVNPYLDDSDTVFAYQAGMGVGYAISKQWTFDVKYRFLGTLKPKFNDSTEFRYLSHHVGIGLRYSF